MALTLTTAGAARRTAELRLPVFSGTTAAGGGAVRMATTSGWAATGVRASHCGFSVLTTKSTASATVTACENTSQSFRTSKMVAGDGGT
jgi:hypothetical protein